MGLLDVAKKAGQLGYEALLEKQERIEKYKVRYDHLDDATLFRKLKTTTGDAKLACMLILKERGYGN